MPKGRKMKTEVGMVPLFFILTFKKKVYGSVQYMSVT